MAYERNRAICEAREAREIEQQQQETLAQYVPRIFNQSRSSWKITR